MGLLYAQNSIYENNALTNHVQTRVEFGMVQAWVGQKLLNCFILQVFTRGWGKNS